MPMEVPLPLTLTSCSGSSPSGKVYVVQSMDQKRNSQRKQMKILAGSSSNHLQLQHSRHSD
eukprot:CAMPEP_0170472110 /NCGR_PEP_ID=MMETSP0123-20130129/14203_1 /TAXON_ID=182087 /ORGANISM="Favella ehrenbergii, Strain Fehren 1" /LENGTH=60 /DNA_ID=CAMNT_0010740177 /DNA_START=95 /DNA_END=277 /DNA_ORIENTATION=+